MIKLNDVTFKYDKVILENINLEIFKSKVTYIVGNNGSGKSTLANIMSGLLFPSSGKVSIDNIDINKKTNNKLVREKIGMVFQDYALFPHMTVEQNLLYGLKLEKGFSKNKKRQGKTLPPLQSESNHYENLTAELLHRD